MNQQFLHPERRHVTRGVMVGSLLLLFILILPTPGGARSLDQARGSENILSVNTVVDASADDGKCSLREAIQAANTDTAVDTCPAGDGADTIVFDPALAQGAIVLGAALPALESQLRLDGSQAAPAASTTAAFSGSRTPSSPAIPPVVRAASSTPRVPSPLSAAAPSSTIASIREDWYSLALSPPWAIGAK